MRAAPRRTAFATAALTAALALWASGAPSVVYPVYGRMWGVPPAFTTLVFGIYPLVLLVVLGLFGGISDRIGRRAAIVLGLSLMAAGTLAFALAPSVGVLLVGRALSGAGVGFALSPATAALAEYAAPGRSHLAGTVATASTAFGLTVALVLGGVILTVFGDPLHASYWPLLGAILVTLVLALRLPSGTRRHGRVMQVLRVPKPMTAVAAQGALGVAAAYGTGGVVLALGADVAVQLLGTDQPLVIGLVLGLSAATIGITAVLARGLRASRGAPFGAASMVIGLAVLVTAGATGSLPVFLGSIVLTAIGYSLLFSSGIGIVAQLAPADHRAATVSAVYLGGYAVQAIATIGLGQLATAAGLLPAIALGAVLLSLLAIAAGSAPFIRARRELRHRTDPEPTTGRQIRPGSATGREPDALAPRPGRSPERSPHPAGQSARSAAR